MIVIGQRVELINQPKYEDVLAAVETAGRVCYKSEGNMTADSAEDFVRRLISRGHEAAIEHASLTVRFVCDRGVSHEIVRHRMASYCQESTRYCNYSKGRFGQQITVIKPNFWPEDSSKYAAWEYACKVAERAYLKLIELGATPQEARSVLPNSLKTEVVMTANMREWRHFLKLRTSAAAHPQMREIACFLKDLLVAEYPVFFEDI